MSLRADLDREMSAMWERIQSRKAESDSGKPASFQITQTVVHLTATAPPQEAEIVDANNYAGDNAPNPDAQGM